MLPDRRGNNRIDSLRNIIRDPRTALLFMIPGVGNTLRVNGRAHITTDPDLLTSFAMDGKVPRSVIVIAVEAVYFQCARALVRSDSMESGKAGGPQEPAQSRTDSGHAERESRRWRSMKLGASAQSKPCGEKPSVHEEGGHRCFCEGKDE